MTGALDIIAAANILIRFAISTGIAWQDIAARVDRAKLEGRDFDFGDIQALRDEYNRATQELDAILAGADDT